jgi:Na+/H+-translocating membrane pyrophosphatase
VIAGVAVGLRSTGGPILLICFALLSTYTLGYTSGRHSSLAVTVIPL